jgi:hypothetical protein
LVRASERQSADQQTRAVYGTTLDGFDDVGFAAVESLGIGCSVLKTWLVITQSQSIHDLLLQSLLGGKVRQS